MRVLVVHPGPAFSVADVYNGVVKGLRANGCTVAEFNLNDRLDFYAAAHVHSNGEWVPAFKQEAAFAMAAKGLEVACYEFWPDVIIVMSGWYIPPLTWGILAKRPHHVVLWCTESPYEDDLQAQPARYADTVILNDPVNLDRFRRDINPNTHYLPHSYDPDVHHPGPANVDLACDFGWVGTGFRSRIDFLEQIDWTGIDVKLAGQWQWLTPDSPLLPFLIHDVNDCMDNAVTAELYRSARISANLYRKETSENGDHHGWAMGPREVELAACGLFFLREPRGEGDEVLPMLPRFTEPAEFDELLHWWLDHDDRRLHVAGAARAAIADRTFTNTTAQLLRLVERTPAAA